MNKTGRELLIELEAISDEIEQLETARGGASLAATPNPVKVALMNVEDAYRDKIRDANERYKRTEKKLKGTVIDEGTSVAGSKFVAVLGGPRVTWDKNGLEEYMRKHPYIRKFRKVGAAPVSIRAAATIAEDEE